MSKFTTAKFTTAMDTSSQPQRVLGEKGSAELTAAGVGDTVVALFAALVRDAKVDTLVDAVVDAEEFVDLVVMAFHTRDCRGGKGERKLFYDLYRRILAMAPETAISLLPLVPEYGSWKDIFTFFDLADDPTTPSTARRHAARLKDAILTLAVDQLHKDDAALSTTDAPKLSLIAKYAPREGKKQSHMVKVLAERLFPDAPADKKKKKYRQLVARCNAAIGTTEVRMCGKRWASIDLAGVPSVCLARSRQAFLNEKVKRRKPLVGSLVETGDRYPDDPDRVACRKNVRAALGQHRGVKGKQLFPHDIIRTVLRGGSNMSTLEMDLVDAQWTDILASVRAGMASDAEGLDLGKMIALVDVSGSMTGTPMEVAMALGLIVADLAAPAFSNRVLTFESKPRWHKINPNHNVVEKVRALSRAPWGGSTNFAAAIDLILEVAVAHNLAADDMPTDLIVLSDMQFDCANGGGTWETQYERLVRRFAEAGEGWRPPTVTFWNLRATAHGGFAVDAHRPGARMLSGFSPAIFKLLLDGALDMDNVDVDDDMTLVNNVGPSPYTTMRKALDDPRYDPVRIALSAATESLFTHYTFIPPAATPVTHDDDDDDLVLVDSVPSS